MKNNTGTRESCTCRECCSACEHKPGWFKFGEPEKAAALLEMSLSDFFKKYLAVEWWEASPNVFLLAPATDHCESGSVYPADPTGRCIFLENGLCKIHAAKPYECAMSLHGDKGNGYKREAMQTWDNPEAQASVTEILGREPEAAEYGLSDAFNWLFQEMT